MPANDVNGFRVIPEGVTKAELAAIHAQSCENCQFWRDIGKGGDHRPGRCKRFPPSQKQKPTWAFPVTLNSDECGEWADVYLLKPKPARSLVR